MTTSETSTLNFLPLSENNPESITRLFSLDPLKLTDTDLDKIVTKLRESRDIFLLAEKNKANKPKKADKKSKLPRDAISLGMLDLDLSAIT